MTAGDFTALFPEFAASTYTARITTLLGVLPPLNASRAGNQLTLALGLWIADKLVMQDITIKYGSAAASSSNSTSTEKRVGEVSIKTSLAQSAGTSTGSGSGRGQTTYGKRYDELIRQFGMGAVAV